MMHDGGEDISAIVAEIGHSYSRVGFAGDDYPRAHFPSTVAIVHNNEHAHDSAAAPPAADCNKRGGRRIKSIVHDYSRPLHEDLGDGTEATTLDGVWEAANPIHPLTGLFSLRDDYAQEENNSLVQPKCDSSSSDAPHVPNVTASSINELSSTTTQYPSTSLELFIHMLEHGTSSLGLGRMCQEGSWAYPLLLLEKSYTSPKMRQTLTEILFEQLQVPKLFLAKDAVMACYAVGRTTGLVVDIGGLGTTVSPVYEGWVEGRGVLRSPIGGDSMSSIMLQKLDQLYLQQQYISTSDSNSNITSSNTSSNKPPYVMPGYQVRTANYQMRKRCFHRLARLDMARRVVESIATVAEYGYDPSKSMLEGEEANVLYELPDGTRIKIPPQIKYEFGELLLGRDEVSTSIREDLCVKRQKELSHFDLLALSGGGGGGGGNHASASTTGGRVVAGTSTVGDGHTFTGGGGYFQWSAAPLQNIICDAAFRCDRDQQAQLLGNVIVTGGGSCLPNLTERIRDDTEIMIHTHTPGWRVKVSSPNFRERSVGSWLGGSIVSSLATFSDMWMTKAEYEEHGATLVNRKCP